MPKHVTIQQQYSDRTQEAIILWTDPVFGGGNRHRVMLADETGQYYTTCNIYDEHILATHAEATDQELTQAWQQVNNWTPGTER